MVGYRAKGDVAEDADGIAREYGFAEGAVPVGVVAPVTAGTTCLVCLAFVCRAASTLAVVQGWASVYVADTHGVSLAWGVEQALVAEVWA